MRLSDIPGKIAEMIGGRPQAAALSGRVSGPTTLPHSGLETMTASSGSGGAENGTDLDNGSGPAPSPARGDPMMRVLSLRDRDAEIEDENEIASAQDRRVAAFFRIRPDMALAFGVSPDRELGIANRAMANLNVVNEGERASFLSVAMVSPEERKSHKMSRWKRSKVMREIDEALRTAPDVALALGVVPGTDPVNAAIGAAESQIGKLSKDDIKNISVAAPDAEEPSDPSWNAGPENEAEESPSPTPWK